MFFYLPSELPGYPQPSLSISLTSCSCRILTFCQHCQTKEFGESLAYLLLKTRPLKSVRDSPFSSFLPSAINTPEDPFLTSYNSLSSMKSLIGFNVVIDSFIKMLIFPPPLLYPVVGCYFSFLHYFHQHFICSRWAGSHVSGQDCFTSYNPHIEGKGIRTEH